MNFDLEKLEQHFDLIGMNTVDKVTGAKGVVVSLAFDLYGCIQGLLQPAASEKENFPGAWWLDVGRLRVTGKKPVMELPDYTNTYLADGLKGPAAKPNFQQQPKP